MDVPDYKHDPAPYYVTGNTAEFGLQIINIINMDIDGDMASVNLLSSLVI